MTDLQESVQVLHSLSLSESRLKKEVARYTEELAITKTRSNYWEKECESLKISFKNFADEVSDLKAQLHEANSSKSLSVNNLERLQQEIEDLKVKSTSFQLHSEQVC